jgi:hypothetical protein
MRYFRLKAANRDDAICQALALRRCVVQSYAGVSWDENGERKMLKWSEI